jgi:hypothetical protein
MTLLHSLITYFREQQSGVKIMNRDFYALVAGKLSESIHHTPPWSWRYVQSVHSGTVAPSKEFNRAVESLAAILDGQPAELASLESVPVFAPHGMLRPGALVWTQARPCANPGCVLYFVPNHPSRRKCFRCSPIRTKGG